MRDGDVHREVTTPRVAGDDRTVDAERVEYCDRVGDMLVDGQRAVERRRGKAALLVPNYERVGTAIDDVVTEWLGVLGKTGAAVQQQDRSGAFAASPTDKIAGVEPCPPHADQRS